MPLDTLRSVLHGQSPSGLRLHPLQQTWLDVEGWQTVYTVLRGLVSYRTGHVSVDLVACPRLCLPGG
jgi:hypothetical protein